MISKNQKAFAERYYGKPYSEILSIAERNLNAAGVEEKWIKEILEDGDGVDCAYQNDIPENLRKEGGFLYLYMTTV